ncbi:MAG TPA: lamin tail domain-containing protein, partial [Propionibacteriaceae bacterium]|nr:lamin tail domain-containing protein [Propionibacteriaceae bacterium]
DGQVKIIGALVNPMGPAPEAETVTLLNTSPQDIELSGWRIADQLERQMVLPQQTLPAGDTVRIFVQPPAQLGNDGGLITLLDGDGLKVDGAAYTKAQAREGWTVPF